MQAEFRLDGRGRQETAMKCGLILRRHAALHLPGRDTEAAAQRVGGCAFAARLDDLAAVFLGQFAMVTHVKFTFPFLANFLQAPHFPESSEADRGPGVIFQKDGNRAVAGTRTSGCGAEDAMRRAENAEHGAKEAGRDAKDAVHNALCILRKTRPSCRQTCRAQQVAGIHPLLHGPCDPRKTCSLPPLAVLRVGRPDLFKSLIFHRHLRVLAGRGFMDGFRLVWGPPWTPSFHRGLPWIPAPSGGPAQSGRSR